MLRHSISQIFTSYIPHEQPPQSEQMFSSLQPSRPRVPLQTQPPLPLNQQPIRHSSSSPSPSSSLPRTQIEAMPPFQPAVLPIIPRPLTFMADARVRMDAAIRHPVFFTDRLVKAPTGVRAGNEMSPVSAGYIFEEGPRRDGARL